MLPRPGCTGGLDDDICARASPCLGAEERREGAALGPAADPDGPTAGVGNARAQHEPDRPEADHRYIVPRRDAGCLDAVQAAGKRLDQGRELGGHAGRDGEEVDARDPLGHEDELCVGAVEQRQQALAQRLLAAAAACTRTARGRVGGDNPAPCGDVDAAELVAEGARRRAQQNGVAAPIRLHVRPVCQGRLDLHEHIAVGLRLGPRQLLDPEIAGAVEHERPHGSKTTLSA